MTADDVDRLCERLDKYAVLCVYRAGEATDPLDAASLYGEARGAQLAIAWLRAL